MKMLVKTISLGLCALSVHAFAAECGDVNGDGRISSPDNFMVQRFTRGQQKLSPEQLRLADVNSDGRVDRDDSLLIGRKYSGEKVTLKCRTAPPSDGRNERLPGFL